jgi:hypothetical protein
VGVHLRSLGLDDPRCDALQGGTAASGCPLTRRVRSSRCGGDAASFLDGCPGRARLAVADARGVYDYTRRLGWRDLNDTPVRTWTPADVPLGDACRHDPWLRCREPGAPFGSAGAVEAAGAAALAAAVAERFRQTARAWMALASCTRLIVAPVRSTDGRIYLRTAFQLTLAYVRYRCTRSSPRPPRAPRACRWCRAARPRARS